MGWYYEYYFPPSTPKEVRGGIRARSKRGGFATNWWAVRWIEIFEDAAGYSNRLGRGRSYARKGQTVDINIEKGKVTASVQGSCSEPYDVTIKLKPIAKKEWKKITSAVSTRVYYAAKLMSGQMPEDIEDLFEEFGLSLFPDESKQIKTNCSCPDWANPCKHIAAVYYLLAEEFDRDPFLIFKLRGITRGELLSGISKAWGGIPDSSRGKKFEIREQKPAEKKKTLPEKLATDIRKFWNGGDLPDALPAEIKKPPSPAGLPKRLGHFPFWRGNEPFLQAMEEIYKEASSAGMEIFRE